VCCCCVYNGAVRNIHQRARGCVMTTKKRCIRKFGFEISGEWRRKMKEAFEPVFLVQSVLWVSCCSFGTLQT
jgi:hypothetical protein